MTITSRGIGLFAGAVLLLLVGFRFGYPELALLGTTAVIAVGCAAGNATWRPRLDVTRVADPDRVGRGEPATMTLTIRNRARLRSANLLAEDRCGGRPVPVPLLRLRPGRDTTVSYPVPTHRRGVVTVGPLRITGRDALGLITVARSHGGTVQVWVHPRIHPLTATPSGVTRSMDGRVDRVPQGSITFDSLREYVVGDELRRVHWRTSARVGELMVKEQLDTSLPRLVVLLDNRAAAYARPVDGVVEAFESACEAAASVVVAARREELPVTLLFVAADPGGEFLDRLAAAELTPGPRGGDDDPLRTATLRLRQERLGDTLVFLTGPAGRADLGYLNALRSAYPSVVVGVFGADGPTPATGAGMVVIDAADGAEFAAEWDGVRRW
ncbi:DUF58 domain-containing protein [Micromonospora sp. HM5-17]|jgi:uncharacterized protein (DUF58 family)|uniref:DUF58 domain-containing protein n=1 Tax=Micromonospora sp. HM5-17 TaxID=2487710 RepID=UPI000F474658|nr:DUF58 domain-containing protein [Micromonospora sp. HM5-17]ROT29331.1 DUF58 domain-containing protein [Micromonospora sp. HM5-17]